VVWLPTASSAVTVPVTAIPAAADPGKLTTSRVVEPGITSTLELVPWASGLTAVVSVPVTVCSPAVASVTAKLCVPFTKAALAGRLAALSLPVTATTGVAELTMLQFPSTAFTVTVN
jgi:hypothetical protein